MRRVIVETPFRNANREEHIENIRYAERCMLDCLLRGEAPFLSHLLYPQVLDDGLPAEREMGIAAGLSWGAAASATIVYRDRGISTDGMERGIAHAKDHNRPIEMRSLHDVEFGL